MKLVDDIIHLRREGLLNRRWNRRDILDNLGMKHRQNTINTVPSNFSISREGDDIGNSVKDKGATPIFWRVGRGEYELIEDPDDDPETQRHQKERAKDRAKLLRGKKPKMTRAELLRMMEGSIASHNSEPAATLPGRVSARPKHEPISPVTIDTASTEEGRKKNKSLSTEQKAIAIVRGFLKTAYGEDVVIEEDRDGVDLRVTIDGKTERIEVKGTKDSDIAWEKLKVSSRKQHDALVSGDATIYRVVDVHSADPRVHILIYGEDFELEPEPRWAVKRIPPDNERYPLRGMPYRYDRPHDPVALEDWEILQ